VTATFQELIGPSGTICPSRRLVSPNVQSSQPAGPLLLAANRGLSEWANENGLGEL